MEQGSLIGFIMVLIGIFVGGILKGVQPAFLFSIPAALLIVIVGAVGAAFLSNPMAMNKNFGKLMGVAFKGPPAHDVTETVRHVVAFADRARREGLLSLEEECAKIEDPFLKKGLQMAIDGADPEQVREVLELEVEAMKLRHKQGAAFMTQIGVFAPTFGIIGAVFGLIATMSHMDDPEMLAHGIKAAFVATFWGVFLANGMFLPFANKLKAFSHHEAEHKTMLVEGILSIQAGANPRVVEDMLLSFLPPIERQAILEERKSA
jgi:chemotaxis protein MotA